MLNKSLNSQEIVAEEELEKGKNEIVELYQRFLKYGRGWLKEEIQNRLKSLNKRKNPDIKVEFGKRKTKIELNIPITEKEIKEIKKLIENLAEELKADKIDIKDNKYLKKQKHISNSPKSEKEEIIDVSPSEDIFDIDIDNIFNS